MKQWWDVDDLKFIYLYSLIALNWARVFILNNEYEEMS